MYGALPALKSMIPHGWQQGKPLRLRTPVCEEAFIGFQSSMKTTHSLLLLAMALVLPANCLRAELATFTLDPSRSSVALSGSASGAALKPQGPGSLEAVYDGTLVLDVGPSEIRFVGGSRIAPRETGSWQPGPKGADGSAPASYGGKAQLGAGLFSISAVAATRRILLDLVGGTPFPLQSGTFNAAGLGFQFVETNNPVLDYKTSGIANEKDGMALSGLATNQPAGMSTLVTEGTVQTLTLKVSATFVFELLLPDDSSLSLSGQLVATRVIPDAPPIVTIAPVSPGATSMTLSWPAGFKLQKATRLSNSAWGDTGVSSPAVISFSGDGEYFQVVPQ